MPHPAISVRYDDLLLPAVLPLVGDGRMLAAGPMTATQVCRAISPEDHTVLCRRAT